jgi:hypothetical protein
MRIVASDLALASASERTVERTHEERVLAWVGERPKDAARGLEEGRASSETARGARVTISPEARARAALSQLAPPRRAESSAGASAGASATDAEAESDPEDPRTLMMRLLVETLTGERVKSGSIRVERSRGPGVAAAAGAGAERAAPRAGWGLEVDVRDTTVDVQEVSFAARGTVETEDGRTIDLAASLSLRDERVTVTSASMRAGDAVVKDPLVLNFSGTPAELEGTVRFDFDADGADETMAFVGAGSGVLALDANGASRPADGAALFGARTGDGFAELAAYDEDRSGFIDEGDAVWKRLGVWTRDAGGAEAVRSLAEVGVGAIAVAHAATTMDLRDDGGELAGRLKATGVYVAESGRVGLVQQIDVAVAEQPAAAKRVDVVG